MKKNKRSLSFRSNEQLAQAQNQAPAPQRVDKEEAQFVLEDIPPLQQLEAEEAFLLNEEEKTFILPQILQNPLYKTEAEHIQQSLEQPYHHLDAKEKLEMIHMLPHTQGMHLDHLQKLFVSQEENLTEEDLEKHLELQRTKHYLKQQLIQEQIAVDSGIRLAKIVAPTPPVVEPSLEPTPEPIVEPKAEALATENLTHLEEISAETQDLIEEESKLIVTQKEFKLKDDFGYKQNIFLNFFASFFKFGEKTLNEEFKVLNYAPKLRLFSTEIPFFFAVVINIMLHITWPQIYKLFSNIPESYLYNFALSHLVIQGLSLTLPLLFLVNTHVLELNKIFGKLNNTSFLSKLLLLALALPLGIFGKSIHNLVLYIASLFNFTFNSMSYPNPSAFLYNQSSFGGQLLGFFVGILFPVLLQGLVFRGILLGHLLSRGFKISALVVLSLAAASFEFRTDYLFVAFLFAFASSFIRYKSGSLNFSLLFHALCLWVYHFSNGWVELLAPNTSVVSSLSGDRILQTSFILSVLLGLLFYGIFTHFKSVEARERILSGQSQTKMPAPFSSLYVVTILISLVAKAYFYFG